MPILIYSASLKLTYTRSQSARITSLHQKAKFITKNKDLKNVSNEINRLNCMFVKKCLNKETSSAVFNNYFEVLSNYRQTRNSGHSLRLPTVKLELGRKSFYFGGASLFNTLPLEIRAKQKTSEFCTALKKYNF